MLKVRYVWIFGHSCKNRWLECYNRQYFLRSHSLQTQFSGGFTTLKLPDRISATTGPVLI